MLTTLRTDEPLFSTADAVLSRGGVEIVREILRQVEGIAEVRVLPARRRPASRRAKVFVVLATHDVRRDSRVVEQLCQVPDIDFDLVPASARTMIPDDAEHIRLD
jgi:hypothetical protein